MGSVGLGNNALLGAFRNKIYAEGLDLGRCQIRENLGVWVADPAATIRQGALVMRDSSGNIVPSNGLDALGVAKWSKASTSLAAVVDEALVLTGTTAIPLAHPTVSNVRVASGLAGSGLFTVTTDYTVNTTNGTVARVALGGITDGATVYVSYTFQITSADLYQLQGVNFWNNLDDVSQNDSRITVITDAEMLFTTQYDTSVVYTMTGATSNLYASTTGGKEGLFTTSTAGSAKFVGRVMQVPSAADPYLGLRLFKSAFAA
jgi:hypothetical protein